VINVSNSTSKNNPLWLITTPVGPTRPSGPAGLTGAGAGQIFLSWLAALPGRLGDRLFAMNDTEAYWRDWQIIKTHGGLGRRYRDPRFALLAECPKCRGTGGPADPPCPPCLGTGQTTREEV
jgi:hypothetical protein